MEPISLGIIGMFSVTALFMARRFKPQLIKVRAGSALVRSRAIDTPLGPKGAAVFFKSTYVVDAFDIWEFFDISLRTLEIERKHNNPVRSKDQRELSFRATFHIRVPQDETAILQIAETVRCEKVGEQETLRTLFEALFSEALEAAAAKMMADEITTNRDLFRDSVIDFIGRELNGFILNELAIQDFKIQR